jgi:hypothetical protein
MVDGVYGVVWGALCVREKLCCSGMLHESLVGAMRMGISHAVAGSYMYGISRPIDIGRTDSIPDMDWYVCMPWPGPVGGPERYSGYPDLSDDVDVLSWLPRGDSALGYVVWLDA